MFYGLSYNVSSLYLINGSFALCCASRLGGKNDFKSYAPFISHSFSLGNILLDCSSKYDIISTSRERAVNAGLH